MSKELETLRLLHVDFDGNNEHAKCEVTNIISLAEEMLSIGASVKDVCDKLNVTDDLLAAYGVIDNSKVSTKKYLVPVKVVVTGYMEVTTKDVEAIPHIIKTIDDDSEILRKRIEDTFRENVNAVKCRIVPGSATIAGDSECLYPVLDNIFTLSEIYREGKTDIKPFASTVVKSDSDANEIKREQNYNKIFGKGEDAMTAYANKLDIDDAYALQGIEKNEEQIYDIDDEAKANLVEDEEEYELDEEDKLNVPDEEEIFDYDGEENLPWDDFDDIFID